MSEESKTAIADCGEILDYIWIEKYRAFRNEGFHFDNEYTYSYDPETQILKRTKNEGYIKNFFGDNISISAIVGGNGSGKTSLLSAIMGLLGGGKDDGSLIIWVSKNGYVHAFKGDKGFHFLFEKNKKNLFLDYEGFSEKYYNDNKLYIGKTPISCIYYTQALDWSQYNEKNSGIINLSNGNLLRASEKPNISNPCHSFFIKEFDKQMSFVDYFYGSFSKNFTDSNDFEKFTNSINFKLPAYVTVNPVKYDHNGIISEIISYIESSESSDEITNLDAIVRHSELVKGFKEYYDEYIFSTITTLEYIRFRKKKFFDYIFDFFTSYKECRGGSYKNIFKSYLSTVFFGALCVHFRKQNGKENSYYHLILYIIETIKKDNLDSFKRLEPWERVENLFSVICDETSDYQIADLKMRVKKLKDFYDLLYDEFFENVNELYKYDYRYNSGSSFRLKYNDKKSDNIYPFKISFKDFWGKYQGYEVFSDIFNVSWDLSSGEICRLELYSRLYHEIEKDKRLRFKARLKNNILLLLDEADMLLHPEWQRRFVYDISEVFPKLFKDKYIQVIIATHSPIMLSDIPKQNVCYLKGNDDSDTPKESSDPPNEAADSSKNEKIYQDQPETFGSNIFKLYTNAFFVKKGAIGVFAKEKLEELLKEIHEGKDNEEYRKDKKRKEKLQQKINIIGDDFLRGKFQDEFDTIYKNNIDYKIAKLEEELKRLRDEKNRNEESKEKKAITEEGGNN